MGQYSCACCGSLPFIDRRGALAGLFAFPLTFSVSATAQSTVNRRPADWIGASYARSMGSDVTGALLSLIGAYGSMANEIGRLQTRQRELADKLATAVRDKAIRLQEYRNGEFCSGCNQTKSEILAKGEQFPHQGQTIIKPTDEQIAAKERELQATIDRLAEELKKVRARLDEVEPNIGEIKSQLFEGMGLWRTANVFERILILQEDAYEAAEYLDRRGEVSRLMAIAQKSAGATEQNLDTLERNASNLRAAIDVLKRLDAERASDAARVETVLSANLTTARDQVARVDSAAKEQAGKITAFGLGGYLNILTVAMTPNFDPRPMTAETSGFTFRMGRYGKDGWGEILPRVAEFVGRARNLRPIVSAGGSGAGNLEISRAESTLARLQGRVAIAEREAAEARRLSEQKRAEEEVETKRQEELSKSDAPQTS